MKNQNQINEVAKIINECVGTNLGQIHGTKSGYGKCADVTTTVDTTLVAESIISAGYHKTDRSTLRIYSDSVLMRQTKQWLVEYIRLLEQLHKDDEQQIDQQVENFNRLIKEMKEQTVQEFAEKFHEKCQTELKVLAWEYGEGAEDVMQIFDKLIAEECGK